MRQQHLYSFTSHECTDVLVNIIFNVTFLCVHLAHVGGRINSKNAPTMKEVSTLRLLVPLPLLPLHSPYVIVGCHFKMLRLERSR